MAWDEFYGNPVTGGGGGGSSGKTAFEKAFNQLLAMPQFLYGYQMMLTLGKDPGNYIMDKKAGKAAYKGGEFGDVAKFGSGKGAVYFDINQFLKDLPGLETEMQQKKVEEIQATYDLLAKTPAYADLFGQAKGEFSADFTQAVDQAFGQIGAQAISGGTKSGFINDPTYQAKLLGPVAMQKVQYLKSIQDAAQAQAWDFAAAGGSAATLPYGSYSAPSASSYASVLPQFMANQQQMALAQDAQSYNKKMGSNQFYMDMAGAAAGMGMGMYGQGQQSSQFNQWLASAYPSGSTYGAYGQYGKQF